MIRAAIFDLGDTLIHFANVRINHVFRIAAEQTYRALQEHLHLTMPPFEAYWRTQYIAIRWAYLKGRVLGREFRSVDVLRQCSAKLNLDVPDDFYEELAWLWYKPLAEASTIDTDVPAMLDRLAAMKLKLAIVSNKFVPGRSLDRHLEHLGLIHAFPTRVYSCELGIGKPRREIFQHVLNQLDVAADESVFIGDNYRCDIFGSRRAGMYAVWKMPRFRYRRLDAKTHRIHRLAELPDVIHRINAQRDTEQSPWGRLRQEKRCDV